MKNLYLFLISLSIFASQNGFSQTYSFDGTSSGWDAKFYSELNINTTVGGFNRWIMKKDPNLTPTNLNATGYERSNNGARLYHESANIDATSNKFVHIKIKNTSINPRLVLVINIPGAPVIVELDSTIETEAEAPSTYTFDMTNVAEWTGTIDDLYFMLRLNPLDANDNNIDKEKATGDALVFQIVASSSNVLSVDDVDFKDEASISIYPNPVNDMLSIKSKRNIERIEAYNVLGQVQKVVTKNFNFIDVSSFNTGVHIMKIYQNDGVVSTKRFVKN